MIFLVPKKMTAQYIGHFVNAFEMLFKVNQHTTDVVIDAYEVSELGMLGCLLLYKVMEYGTHVKKLLSPKINIEDSAFGVYAKVGFGELFGKVSNFKINSGLKYKEFDGFFIAPINLNVKDYDNVNTMLCKKINDYYNNQDKAFALLTCITEIASNFHEHSKDEQDSILVARGNKKEIEIACADTGIGVVTSLMKNERYRAILGKADGCDILAKAFEKGVTSKDNSNHMGYGLWLVKNIVGTLGGEIHIYSENAHYINKNGKIKKGANGYWKGTIIYVKLALNNEETIHNFVINLTEELDKNNELLINFG